jgi:hypothetical protein
MAHTALCFRVRFGGQNIQATINLKCVGIDNLGIEFLRQFDCQRRFSDGRGTNDEESILHAINCRGVSVREAIYVRPAAGTAALQFSRPYRIAGQLRKPAGGTRAARFPKFGADGATPSKKSGDGLGPRLPVQSESTIRSANVRSISLRSRPACGRGIPCHAARSPLASLRPRFAFAQKRSPWSADYVYSSRLPHSARGRPR